MGLDLFGIATIVTIGATKVLLWGKYLKTTQTEVFTKRIIMMFMYVHGFNVN